MKTPQERPPSNSVDPFTTNPRPRLMGIVNVTPDSFYDGGQHYHTDRAVEHARTLAREGADVIDIGGESTRPGAQPVSDEEELNRVLPVVEKLTQDGWGCPISVDTRNSSVARAALEAGADWINDVSGLRGDPELAEVVAEYDARVVIMHMQGTPDSMQDNPEYDHVLRDIRDFFQEQIKFANSRGISDEQIILDPGIGFGKTVEHNRQILSNVSDFKSLGYPVLIGHSRKSYHEAALGLPPEQSLHATLAVSTYLSLQQVDYLRIHDVRPHHDLREALNWLKGA